MPLPQFPLLACPFHTIISSGDSFPARSSAARGATRAHSQSRGTPSIPKGIRWNTHFLPFFPAFFSFNSNSSLLPTIHHSSHTVLEFVVIRRVTSEGRKGGGGYQEQSPGSGSCRRRSGPWGRRRYRSPARNPRCDPRASRSTHPHPHSLASVPSQTTLGFPYGHPSQLRQCCHQPCPPVIGRSKHLVCLRFHPTGS